MFIDRFAEGMTIYIFLCDGPNYLPRVYPLPFARAVCDLIEQMKSTARGQPELPHHGRVPSAWETMQTAWAVNTELWGSVDFSEVFGYLRGSTKLKIPDEWYAIIPKQIS